MGEHSGRGLFATKDIKECQTIGLEKTLSLDDFNLPSIHQIIQEMYDWATKRDDEAYAYTHEVLESILLWKPFQTGYGFWLTTLGRTHSTVDSGAMMFCNHGCNGTYNLGRATGFTEAEANVDLRDRDNGASRIIYPRARSIQASHLAQYASILDGQWQRNDESRLEARRGVTL